MLSFSNPQNSHQEFSPEGNHSAASIAIGSSTVLPDHLHVSKGEAAVSANEVTTSQRSITGFAGAEIPPEFEAKFERLPGDVPISGAHRTRRTTDFLFVLMD